MDLITLLCFIAVAAIVGVAIWWARRENARLDAEALEAFASPMDDPEQQAAGRPIWRPGDRR